MDMGRHSFILLAVLLALVPWACFCRPTFHASFYDPEDAEFSRKRHFQNPIVNAGDLIVSHRSTRRFSNESHATIAYDGALRGDTPIVKLDNVETLESMTCAETSDRLFLTLTFASDEDLQYALEAFIVPGHFIVGGHEWECAHSQGAIVLAKVLSVQPPASNDVDGPSIRVETVHASYTDLFEDLSLEFSTNAFFDRNKGVYHHSARNNNDADDELGCPLFNGNRDVEIDDPVLSAFYNILNQVEQVTDGLKTVVEGLSILKDSFAQEWDGDGASFTGSLGLNYNPGTGNALCEIPMVEDEGGNPILSCRNCYAYANATLSMSIDITGAVFNNVEVKLSGEAGFKIDLQLGTETQINSNFLEDVYRDAALSAPIVFFVGPIPIFAIPTGTTTIGVVSEMTQQALFGVVASQVNTAEVGAGWSRADGPYRIDEMSFGPVNTDITRPENNVEINAGAYIDTAILMKVNYLGGPTISMRPFVELVLQDADDPEEYCRQLDGPNSLEYMGGSDWGLSLLIGADYSFPPLLSQDEFVFPLVEKLVFYEPVRDFCLRQEGGIVSLTGNPLLHHTSWVGTMTTCSSNYQDPSQEGTSIPVEIIYRDLVDGESQFEIVFNDPCTGIGLYRGDPVNTENQTGVNLYPIETDFVTSGALPDAFCEYSESTYNKYDVESPDQILITPEVLENLTLSITNGWRTVSLIGECNTITAEFGREPWLDNGAGSIVAAWMDAWNAMLRQLFF